MAITIAHTIRTYPTLPYEKIAYTILGKNYDLSLTFVGTTRAQALNQTYRKKDYVPNVLSFPLTESAGEIYICPAVAKTEADAHNLSVSGYIGFLFIHGCLHLKGYDHSDTMDKEEQRYLKKFSLT